MTLRKNILVIDSNDFHFDVLKESLSQSPTKYVLTRAFNPDCALNLMRSHRYDLIITEDFEPNGHGAWILQYKSKCRGAPLIVLTSKKDEKKAVDAMKMGADDYIIKSHEILSSLPLALAKTIEKKRKRVPLIEEQKIGRFQIISKNLKNIAEIINEPSKSFAKGKKQLKELRLLEREIESLKGMLKNLIS